MSVSFLGAIMTYMWLYVITYTPSFVADRTLVSRELSVLKGKCVVSEGFYDHYASRHYFC